MATQAKQPAPKTAPKQPAEKAQAEQPKPEPKQPKQPAFSVQPEPIEQPKPEQKLSKLSELSHNTINFFIKNTGQDGKQVEQILTQAPDEILNESEFSSTQIEYVINKLQELDASRIEALEKIVGHHDSLESEMGKLSYSKRALIKEKGLPHYKKLEAELEDKIYPIADKLEAEGLVYPYEVAPLNIEVALSEFKILRKSEEDALSARDNVRNVTTILNTVHLDVPINKFKISQIPAVTFLLKAGVEVSLLKEFVQKFAISAKGGGSKGGGGKGSKGGGSLSYTIHTKGGSFKNTSTGVFCPSDWFQAQSSTLKTGYQEAFNEEKTARIAELEAVLKANMPIGAEEATEMAKKDAVKFITLAGARTKASASAQEILTGILKGTIPVIPTSMSTQVFPNKEALLKVYPQTA